MRYFGAFRTEGLAQGKLLLSWVVYFVFYALTERCIPPERCIPTDLPLDHRIPFLEIFLIPYVVWFGLIAFSLGYFLLYRPKSFRRLQTYFIITQVIAVTVFLLLPTRQDLRPAVFPRDNLLTRAVAALYRADTSTGVCPSLHVAFSLGLASVWCREPIRPFLKASLLIWVVLICLSTLFIKQHSVTDVLCTLPVCLVAEGIIWRDRLFSPFGYPPGGLPSAWDPGYNKDNLD